jgi:hypothetical protein
MEAMFAAESQNWNETQEKMAQYASFMRVLSPSYLCIFRGQRVYSTNRYGPRKPGGPPGGPGGSGAGSSMPPRDTRFHPYSDRPIPQGYVCFRCGQKGELFESFFVSRLISYQATGYKTAQPTKTKSLTTNPESSEQQAFREAS